MTALLGVLLGGPLLLCVLWLMAVMGDAWWLYVWLTWVGFNLLIVTIYPIVIAPLFNRFTPLEDLALKARIEQLLARCGFRSQGLFVMDNPLVMIRFGADKVARRLRFLGRRPRLR